MHALTILSILANRATEGITPGEVQLMVLLLIVTLVVALISRRLNLPYTLVLVVVGLIIGISPLLPNLHLDPDVVLLLFLPALLFEGAWSMEIKYLIADWLPVVLLAVPGLVIALLVVAAILHWALGFSWLVALLLGAMISPTDPIAVLALFRQMHMSDRLRTIVEGESLFNDGVGAVAYTIVLELLFASLTSGAASHPSPAWLIVLEALWLMTGGLIMGFIIALITARLLRRVDDHLIEITVTFSVAYGVYLLAEELHTSGLLAVVGAGLIFGSYGRQTGMSERTREAADGVWEFIGYIANSLLFLLLGVQIGGTHLIAALGGIGWALAGVIVGRLAMVYLLIPLHDAFIRWRQSKKAAGQRSIFSRSAPLSPRWRPILVLSGLRGALSIALALSLPENIPQRNLIQDIVFGVVLITLLGQGIALRVLLPHWQQRDSSQSPS